MIEGLLRPQHLLIILVVALFVFGGKKLPELGKGLGEGIKGFRDSMRNITSEPEEPTPASTSATSDKKS